MSHHKTGIVSADQLNQLRSIVESWQLDEQGRLFCDDLCLKRYIYSYGHSVEKASKSLKETVEWRSSTLPARLTLRDPDVAMFAKTGIAYVHGTDRQGHPIVWVNLEHDLIPCLTTELQMKRFKFLLYIMEKAITTMPPGVVDQWSIVINLNNTIGITKEDIIFGKRYLVKPLNDFYAERLSSCILINAPVLFFTIWNLCKPFMDKTTIQKYRILKRGGSTHQQFSVLSEIIDPSQIPRSLGGTDAFVYKFDDELQLLSTKTEKKNDESHDGVPVQVYERHNFACSAEATSSSPLDLEEPANVDVLSET